ncbi:MAG: alpha/beta hydrolase [Crocinitomicaceae bacterium]|jgi:pimeloyl-ACP methyl ester carboxylesterase|nr:alpha/beta hydrolase [Crocinitomicaceae bacterium]MBT6030657.1 alpha/beta hydrolase [Crocinitomicaceae bacterium]MBT6515630.1 alpha/beta hydrolase [Crocinitomicaceae bacterium]MDG2330922.1 alpha/beta hydrolase [Flavobacteriales bacterium]
MTVDELLQKYTSKESKWIDIFGVKVHYRDEGSGPIILLLHGTFSSLHTFNDWTEILKDNFRVIRLDMPGFGLTGPSPNNNYSIDQFTTFLQNFTDSLEIENFFLVGNSLGGWLSWEYALQNPNKVKKLILIDSAGYINDNNYPLPFIIAQTPVLRNVFNFIPKAVVRRFVRQVYCDQSKVTTDIVNRYYDMIHRDGNKEAFVYIANSNYKQNTHNLTQLLMPVLILWGKEDKWLSVDHAFKFQRDIPNNELIIYDNMGHVPMEECPEKTAIDVQEFLLNS